MNQLILPSSSCQQLGHKTARRLKQPGPGVYEYCVVCTLGYDMAYTHSDGDETYADNFVKDLRRHP